MHHRYTPITLGLISFMYAVGLASGSDCPALSQKTPPESVTTGQTPLVASAHSKILYQYKSDGIEVPAATADEPTVKAFGPDTILAAKKYLDDGAHYWVREKSCVACHTSGVYMVERPVVTPLLGKPSSEVREDFVSSIPKKPGGSSIKSVWLAEGLASWDKYVAGALSPDTDKALRHMFTCMAEDAYFKPIAQVEIPYITTAFELTVQAARAVANAPGWLASIEEPALLKRINAMKGWLRLHAPVSDYELALKLQLAALMPDVVPEAVRKNAVSMLWRQQLADGGWSTRRISDIMRWHEKMDPKVVAMIQSEPDAANPGSDPYMTAWAIVLLREEGIPVSNPRIQKGVAWLKANQRVSGRWWMKSLFRDTYHYSTYISTAQALRALAICGEVPKLSE
ncbi:MAG: hypothetical protein JWO08_2945 [Verrucomicrobiaceae bacterium]|nr:hypothetical protein [Verrucomicrobiaceae bacterium]